MQWIKLNTEYSDIILSIRKEWIKLLSNNSSEEECHKFIAEHSAMCWGKEFYFSISKLNLGGSLTPDFILVSEKGSFGLHYTLVEIEKPSTSTITKINDPTSGLTHAIKQIRDWKNWIEKNSQEAGLLFPAKFSHDNMAHLNYMIIAGRRINSTIEQDAERVKLSREVGYPIRSFDYITDNLKQYRSIEHIIPNSDTDDQYWREGYYHKFANPFYQSVSNKAWKKFVESPSLIRTHMIGRNIKQLNEIMIVNNKYYEFERRIKS